MFDRTAKDGKGVWAQRQGNFKVQAEARSGPKYGVRRVTRHASVYGRDSIAVKGIALGLVGQQLEMRCRYLKTYSAGAGKAEMGAGQYHRPNSLENLLLHTQMLLSLKRNPKELLWSTLNTLKRSLTPSIQRQRPSRSK